MLSDKDSECAQLLSKAASQARKRGDLVAGAIGTSITGVKNISTSCSLNQPAPRYSYTRNMLMAKSAAGAQADEAAPVTNIEAGTIKVYANVDAVFFVK